MNPKQLTLIALTLSLVPSLSACREMAKAFKDGYYGNRRTNRQYTAGNSSISASTSTEAQMIEEARGYLQTGSAQPWTTPEQAVHQYRVIWVALYLASNYGVTTGDFNGAGNLLNNLEKVAYSLYVQLQRTGMEPQYLEAMGRSGNSAEAHISEQAMNNQMALLVNNPLSAFWMTPACSERVDNILQYITGFRIKSKGMDFSSESYQKYMREVQRQYEYKMMNSIPRYN